VDGDTCVLDLDLGFYHHRLGRSYRLARIDAPERGSVGADAATAALADKLSKTATLLVTTSKADSFDRWIVDIYADGVNVSDWLVQEGHAVYRTYT
jgi:endonuclease YncB( thermonuclease family)